jgi:anti-sigma B factor antagonist
MRVVAIEGGMTVHRAGELKQALLAPLASPGPLHVDLSRVTELDSAGVQLLVLIKRLADVRQIPLRLVACSPAVVEVLELLNLRTHLDGPPSSTAQDDANSAGMRAPVAGEA